MLPCHMPGQRDGGGGARPWARGGLRASQGREPKWGRIATHGQALLVKLETWRAQSLETARLGGAVLQPGDHEPQTIHHYPLTINH